MMSWRPAEFWSEEEGRPVCTLCPYRCAPEDGRPGRCRLRRRSGTILQTAAFTIAARHWHPVERKPFFHLFPGREVLTLGVPGCNFRCDYCENAILSQWDAASPPPFALDAVDPAAVVEAARCRAGLIALSYGEPILAAELTLALHANLGVADLGILWKSNGFIERSALRRLAPALAGVNLDLKAADEGCHQRLTGAPLAPVLTAMEDISALGPWLEISTPLIPGVNDDDASISDMARQILRLGTHIPWHLLRFHPDGRRQEAWPTTQKCLIRARAIALDLGLYHVYAECSSDGSGLETRCPSCGSTVIGRHRHTLVDLYLRDGSCPQCGSKIAGRW